MKDELKAALIYAASTATRAEIEGMTAENQHRIVCDNQISYGVEAFLGARDELRSEVKRIVDQNIADAASDVLAERKRQIEAGSAPDHGAQYSSGQLARVAAAYALMATGFNQQASGVWPVDWEWPRFNLDGRENLVRAGALIIAEIERIDRLSAKGADQ